MGIESDRRRNVRLQVLRAYFRMVESGRADVSHTELSEETGLSVHAVGRVLRWAERRGLAVASDPRRRRAGPEAEEQARETLRSLDNAQSDSGDGAAAS